MTTQTDPNPSKLARALRYAVVLSLVSTTIGGLGGAMTASADPLNTVFSDGFEAGNTWIPYSNGANPTQTIVTDPVHSGTGALQLAADTAVAASDIGLADIKDLSFTENQSQLSFWYYAGGGATFQNLTIEAQTSTGGNYFTILPAAVVTNTWTEAHVMFSGISPSLSGAVISRLVIKAVAAPNSGQAQFTIDDVAIVDGVNAPANLVVTSPTNGAVNVNRDRVLTTFYDAALDPTTVSTSTVHLTASDGQSVPIAVRYEAGQKAIAVVPLGRLAARTVYDIAIAGVATATGAGTVGDPGWRFTTGIGEAGTEGLLSDDLSSGTDWSLYSNAPSSSSALVTAPVVSLPTALQSTAEDETAPFVVSRSRQTNWLDENSMLAFDYQIHGSATPQNLIVALTTAAGFTKFKAFPINAATALGWVRLATRVADIDPGLVGQVIRTVELKVETSTPGTISYTLDNVRVTSNMGQYQHAVDDPTQGAATTGSHGGADAPDGSVVTEVRYLVTQIQSAQQPDGSIVVGPTTAGFNNKVDPYAANYAALGLLRAYQVTHDRADLVAADQWLAWYQSHMGTDGVVNDCLGFYPNCIDTGSQDSVDSYASTYLLASLKDYTLRGSQAAKRSNVLATYKFVQLANKALDSVYEQDGTTIAKPSYPVRFTMDNAETYNGLVASVRWAVAAGDPVQASLSQHLAARNMYALRNRFNAPSVGYAANAVDPNGSLELSLSSWYPDALSSILLLAHTGRPTDADRTLFNRLVTQFDTNDQAHRPTALTDTPQYMWWAQAALRVGEPKASAHFVDEYYAIEGKRNPGTFAITAGHLIRALTYSYDGSLWF